MSDSSTEIAHINNKVDIKGKKMQYNCKRNIAMVF